MAKGPRNRVNILNHSVKVIGGGVGKDKDIIGQDNEYFINKILYHYIKNRIINNASNTTGILLEI